jgi:hypothetical protein
MLLDYSPEEWLARPTGDRHTSVADIATAAPHHITYR